MCNGIDEQEQAMREYDLTNKLEKIVSDLRLENQGGSYGIFGDKCLIM